MHQTSINTKNIRLNMKITTFTNSFATTKNNNNKFYSFPEYTDYSKILDDLISSNLMKTNSYLKKSKDDALIDAMFDEAYGKTIKLSNLEDSYNAAAKYLAFFGKKNKLTYNLGHTYYIDNTPIIFHLDSIEIGGNEYYYDDLLNASLLTKNTQKLIIKIATSAPKINININL